MELFFSNHIIDDIIYLDSQESRHCTKVLRKSLGDKINVVDGLGNLYFGEIIYISKSECKVEIASIEKDYGKKNYYIHIAISPIKNHDRLEWFVEKTIEIGVDEISFINCERNLRKNIKMERINRLAITAMKQTLKSKLPKINNIKKFSDFLKICNQNTKFICHLDNNDKKNFFHYKNSILKNKSSCILIGPEGDFSSSEVLESKKFHFQSISLGNSRLRTETAGVVSCNLINVINEC